MQPLLVTALATGRLAADSLAAISTLLRLAPQNLRVSGTENDGLRVAVRAEELQVARPVIQPISVAVIHVQDQWPVIPHRPDAAFLTEIRPSSLVELAEHEARPGGVEPPSPGS